MSKVISAIIFDGDDTLWAIQAFYDEAKDAFYKLMEDQGFDVDDVRVKFTEIDSANLAKYGFSKLRFPQSMRDTYRYFCTNYSVPEELGLAEKAAAIGASVFDRRPELLPGARKVLSQLRGHYKTFLYSVGDVEVQWGKVHALALEHAFDAVYITEKKDQHQLQAILVEQKLKPQETWMVGNSLRSDINPALRVGLRCIWVHAKTWHYDHEEMLPGDVWPVNDLREIPAILSAVETSNNEKGSDIHGHRHISGGSTPSVER